MPSDPTCGLHVMEAIRLDQEPVSKTGRRATSWAFESPRFRSLGTGWVAERECSALLRRRPAASRSAGSIPAPSVDA